MTEQYQVTIQGQLGPREGVLTLSYQESYITGSLDLVAMSTRCRACGQRMGRSISFIPSKRW